MGNYRYPPTSQKAKQPVKRVPPAKTKQKDQLSSRDDSSATAFPVATLASSLWRDERPAKIHNLSWAFATS